MDIMTTPKIKVMHVISDLEIGGAQEVVRTLVKFLKTKDCIPFVCTLKDGPLRLEIERLGIQVDILVPRRHSIVFLPGFVADMIRIWRSLAQLVSKNEIDIIQTHLLRSLDFLVLLLKYTTSLRAVFFTFHNVKFELSTTHVSTLKWLVKPKRLFHRLLYRLTFRFVSGIIAVSDEVKTALLHTIRPSQRKITVIYNGVDSDKYRKPVDKMRVRRHLGFESSVYLITVVAALIKQKGHTYLIEAVSRILPKYPHVHTLLIGEGDLKHELQNQAKQQELEKHIHFLGNRHDVSDLLASSDLFVLPSLWEGLPMALLEAMASGLPIVATTVSGTVKAMISDKTGLLVPPGNTDRLVEAIEKLLSDISLAKTMGEAAKQRVKKELSAEKQADEHLALYYQFARG